MKYSVRYMKKKYKNSHESNPYMQMLEKKLKEELNNFCVECGTESPEYISINNGIFLCSECVQNHLHFPKNISRIVNNNIKSLTLDEIQFLLCGGNKALLDFINNEFPKLSEFPPYILYRTQAMVYYRQNLLYLINGGIAPIKPSLKYAYKVSNFINNLQSEFNNMKENVSSNFTMSENETFQTIQEERKLLNNINNFENYANNSNYNFSKGRKINIDNKNFNDRINSNTHYTLNKNNDLNYIINKPRQINFQNNNNIIIGNFNTHNGVTEIKQERLMTSQEKINIDSKPKNKRKIKNILQDSTNYLNNINEIYVKPKLVLSPKVNVNCITINGNLSQRNRSVDTEKNYKKVIQIFEEKKINKDAKDIIKKRLNKNSSQDCYVMTQDGSLGFIQNKGKYIHKSLSQRNIKNENDKIINKKIIHNYKDKKYLINTNIERTELLSRMQEIKNNKKNLQKNIVLNLNNKYTINNTNFATEHSHRINQIESLPIKINLKHKNNNNKNEDKNKEIKLEITKTQIINEKNYFSSDESNIKDNNNSINKTINREKEKVYNNDDKENIPDNKNKSNKTSLCKHYSQMNVTKDPKDKNKKLFVDKVNNKDVRKESIRNKYKLRRKNNF